MGRIIVLGGSGFIGRNLVEFYSEKSQYKVIATYLNSRPEKINEKVNWVKCDLRNPVEIDSLLQKGDIVIQAAATTSGAKDIVNTPSVHVTDNAVMNSYLFRAATEIGVKHLLFFSCTVMYHNSEIPLKENEINLNKEFHPKYFGVGWTKVYLEKMAKFFSDISETKFTVFRHSNVIGPFDKYNDPSSHMFAALFSKLIGADKKLEIWGDGTEKRDLIYVSDLIEAVDLSIQNQSDKFELFNIGSGEAYSVNEVVGELMAAMNISKEIVYNKNAPTIKSYLSLNCDYAYEKIGWKVSTPLSSAIGKTLKWYREYYC